MSIDLLRRLLLPRTAAPHPPRDPGAAHAADAAELTREDGPDGHADLVGRLDGLLDEIGKLGREQFQATTLLEGQGQILEELAEAWRDHLDRHERAAVDVRRSLAELEERARLGLVKDLLPIADALDASVRAARDLLAGPPAEPPPAPSPLAWLRDVLGGAAPRPAPDRSAALESWLEGLLLVERRLLALLEREGVRPIRAVGQPFDPHRHLAVAVEHDAGAPDGTVIGEELRGYTLGDRVLRHAEVVVARARSNGEGVSETGGD